MFKKAVLLFVSLFFLLCSFQVTAQTGIPDRFKSLIDKGEFSRAQQLMRQELATNPEMAPAERLEVCFEIERLERIKKDFAKTEKEIVDYIERYYPRVSEADLRRWEKEKSLEFMIIDGEKRYFDQAGPNLFRIDRELRQLKKAKEKPGPPPLYNRLEDVKKIVEAARASGKRFVNPVHVRVTYTLTVAKDAVPAGEVIRCWLPFPREIEDRQTGVKLISSKPGRHIIADNRDYLQRSIYLEQAAEAGKSPVFEVVFEFENYAVHQKIDPARIVPAKITAGLEPFVRERPPHVVFSEELKTLNRQIVGDEKNPYLIARKIFKFISDNIPWASAREYSTFYNISDYVRRNMHCDCGMHSIFFITLCRMNGIPARWQSGWTTKPGGGGMHDWGEIYFEPYGWLPCDADIGVLNSEDEDIKWFFLGGMDAYRLIVNDDYSRPLYPLKIHHRSETVDFQRGEVEWRGGNLYFDQWRWNYDVKLLNR